MTGKEDYDKHFSRSTRLRHSPPGTPSVQQARNEDGDKSPIDDAADLAARKSAEAASLAASLEVANREARKAEEEVRRLQQEECRLKLWQEGLATISSQSVGSEGSISKRKRRNEDDEHEDPLGTGSDLEFDLDDASPIDFHNISDVSVLMDRFASGVITLAKGKRAPSPQQAKSVPDMAIDLKARVAELQAKYLMLKGMYREQGNTINAMLNKGDAGVARNDLQKMSREITREVTDRVVEAFERAKVPQRVSYASVAGAGLGMQTSARNPDGTPGKFEAGNSNKNTILLYPKGDEQTSEELRDLLKSKVNPTSNAFQVKRMSKISNNGVALEFRDAGQVENARKILEPLADVKNPKAKRPLVLIYDLPSIYAERDLSRDIWEQNFKEEITKEEFQAEHKWRFRTGPKRTDQVNWVLEVTGRLHKIMMRQGRIYLNWTSSRVVTYSAVQRCYKCQKYGHVAQYCKAPHDICSHCAQEGHRRDVCPSKDQPPCCVNCKASKRPDGHSAGDVGCFTYTLEKTRAANSFDYEC